MAETGKPIFDAVVEVVVARAYGGMVTSVRDMENLHETLKKLYSSEEKPEPRRRVATPKQ